MQDPFAWSIPFGRLFGVTIRIHILFPFVAVGLLLRAAFREKAVQGQWIDVLILEVVLFISVLLHEFGHCFGARSVNGDAQEILIWPLGGLASVDVPHTPRAHFITTIAGPAVNFVLALVGLLGLYVAGSYQPHWDPTTFIGRENWLAGTTAVGLKTWSGELAVLSPYALPVLLNQLFWVNYVLFLFNMVLIGYPMDGGRLFQSIAWRYVGYRRGTLAAIYAGFITMFVVGLYAIIVTSVLALCLALFIYFSCKAQWILLETGGEESLFGYDFSQGYTSLERDDTPTTPPARRKGWLKRWLEKRAARKAQREEEQRVADEQRLDELLEKVQRQGMNALSDEERRFMKRVSDRYRNRPRP
jgi:stage IV sporulation protein FB